MRNAKEEFSEEMVEQYARAYKKKHGKVPSKSGTECLPDGWTWNAINQRLGGGLRKFLIEKGIAIAKEQISEEIIELIQKENPDWKLSDPVCSHCIDIYESRFTLTESL
ncbi:MAG: hypothetical protein IID12_03805 [Candidatus Marinimicrobia bacterium]|nr:hypothetical protein [Candidatus Neomarinimicrobiota bacterium]